MSGRRQGQTVAKHHTSFKVIKSDRFQLERFRAIKQWFRSEVILKSVFWLFCATKIILTNYLILIDFEQQKEQADVGNI